MGNVDPATAGRPWSGDDKSAVTFVDSPSDLARVAPDEIVVMLSLRPWSDNLQVLLQELVERRAAGMVIQDASITPVMRARLVQLAEQYGLPVFAVPPTAGPSEALDDIYAHSPGRSQSKSKSLQQADSLSEVADALSSQIMCSITIEDRDFGVLAYSAQDLNVDSARISSILRKHVPEEVVSALRKHGIQTKLRTASKPLRVEPIPEIGLGHRLVMPLRLGNELLGHIWVIDPQDTLPDETAALLQQAAKRAVQILSRDQQAVQERRTMVEGFLHNLFLGHFPNEESAAHQARKLGLSPSSTRIVLLVSLDEPPAHGGGVLFRLESAGVQLNTEILACEAESGIWALCGFPAGLNHWQLRHQVTRLMQRMLEHPPNWESPPSVSVGVGLPFGSFLEAQSSFRCASVALRWGSCMHEHPRIMFSDDLGALRLVQIPAGGSATLPTSRSLQVLIEYDRKKGTDLLQTLECFLDEAGNVRRTASRLHVHPNTLLYRLQRIQEVTRMDLDSGPVRLLLHLELKVQALCRSDRHGPTRP